jgi:hypothetical protein
LNISIFGMNTQILGEIIEFLATLIHGFTIWSMVDGFFSCGQLPLILPLITAIFFAIKQKFKIFSRKSLFWRIVGIFLGLILPNYFNTNVTKAILISLGVAFSFNGDINPKCLLDGLLSRSLAKLTFLSDNPFYATSNLKFISLFIAFAASLLHGRNQWKPEIEDLLSLQGKSSKNYTFEWAKIGLWLFLVKKFLLSPQFCDSFVPSVIVNGSIIVFRAFQAEFVERKLMKFYCLFSGMIWIFSSALIKVSLSSSMIATLSVFGMRPMDNTKGTDKNSAIKSFLLFCKLIALDLKFEESKFFTLMIVVVCMILSIVIPYDKGNLKNLNPKRNFIGKILFLLWISSAAIRGKKTACKKKNFETFDLDSIRIPHLESEAVYLIKDDLGMLPLIRVSITKDIPHNIERAKSLLLSLDLDVIVFIKDRFTMSGMLIGEQSDQYYYTETKDFSLLSKFPLSVQGKENGAVNWVSLNVGMRTIDLIIWTNKVQKPNIQKLRNLQEKLVNNSTLLLGALHIKPLGPDYHLIFKPTSLNPIVFPK